MVAAMPAKARERRPGWSSRRGAVFGVTGTGDIRGASLAGGTAVSPAGVTPYPRLSGDNDLHGHGRWRRMGRTGPADRRVPARARPRRGPARAGGDDRGDRAGRRLREGRGQPRRPWRARAV